MQKQKARATTRPYWHEIELILLFECYRPTKITAN